MRRSAAFATAIVLGAVLFAGAGCNSAVVGNWRLERAIPSREVMALDDLRFARDGTFSASATIDGRKSDETGTYEFSGSKLVLRPSAGGQREYNAALGISTLELAAGGRRVVPQGAMMSEQRTDSRVRRRVIYRGQVQGVFFRANARELAAGFRVVGYVRNCEDGTVEIEVEGPSPEVRSFLAAVKKRYAANILDLLEVELPPRAEEETFEIRH